MITWRKVESSNVAEIGWPCRGEHDYGPERCQTCGGPDNCGDCNHQLMLVRFTNGHVYAYLGVSRQRAVAATLQSSVGGYINRVIKPRFPSLQVNSYE